MSALPTIFQLRTGMRQAVSRVAQILPEKTNVAIERRVRGYEESKKLARADGVVVSFGKSGRTWLTVLVSRYFQKKYGLPEGKLMEFDNFHRRKREIPVIWFTHDNYLKNYTGDDGKFANYGASRVVLLVRDPRDTAVSQYFQWKHRMTERKKVINGYPKDDPGIYEFVAGEKAGIPKILDFMNGWAKDAERFSHLEIVKYEDLRASTATQLRRVLEFFGQKPGDAELEDCVNYASIDNMRRMERENAGKWLADSKLKPGDAGDPASFKVRRAKVGGWRDYMSEEQAEAIGQMVNQGLSPFFGYK